MTKFIAVFFTVLCLSNTSRADSITTVIGYSPGGLDTAIRMLLADAEKHSDLKFTVINRPGANGSIALRRYFDSSEHLSSLLGVSGGQILFEPLVRPNNNWLSDLRIIGPVMLSPLALAAGPKSTITDVGMLFDRTVPARQINIGVAGESHQMFVKVIAAHSHHNIVAIPFKGSANAYAALLGGHVDLAVSVYGDFVLKGDAVRIITVAQPEGMHRAPGLGRWIPGFEIQNFFAVALSVHRTDYADIGSVLSKTLSGPAIERMRQNGYVIDANANHDFVARRVWPWYQQWLDLTVAVK